MTLSQTTTTIPVFSLFSVGGRRCRCKPDPARVVASTLLQTSPEHLQVAEISHLQVKNDIISRITLFDSCCFHLILYKQNNTAMIPTMVRTDSTK